ncbi:MAG: FxLYD domain-containing protein [Thermodesulfobacteriota bacterium]
MKKAIYILLVLTSYLLLSGSVYSDDYSSEIEVELKPDYNCAADHLHIPGMIKNKSNLTLEKVKVEGRAYDENGNLISSTTSWVDSVNIASGKTATFDLEFLDITGSVHDKVKSYDVKVIEVEKASP